MEKSLVEQIAVAQWKLVRLDRYEAKLYEPDLTGAEFAMAIHRVYLTQIRLQRVISSTIVDIHRYRKDRLANMPETANHAVENFHRGIIWCNSENKYSYAILPQVLGLDGEWRDVPREVLADLSAQT